MVTGLKPNSGHLATAVYYKGTASGLSKAATLRPAETAAVGDLDKDGYGDIALGVPQDPDSEPAAATGGRIHVVYGTGAGPSATRRVSYTQNTAGVPDSSEPGDGFGGAPAIGDFDKNGYGDLAVGASGESFGDDTDYLGSAGAITPTQLGLSTNQGAAPARTWRARPGRLASAGLAGRAHRLASADPFGLACPRNLPNSRTTLTGRRRSPDRERPRERRDNSRRSRAARTPSTADARGHPACRRRTRMHAQPRLALASAAAATLTGGLLTFSAATVTGVVTRCTPYFGANFAD